MVAAWSKSRWGSWIQSLNLDADSERNVINEEVLVLIAGTCRPSATLFRIGLRLPQLGCCGVLRVLFARTLDVTE